MKYLEFEVSNMTLRRKNGDKTSPTSGTVNYYGIEVSFDAEFADLAGAKSVEFYKNRYTEREDLVEGKCKIPNIFLRDKNSFDIRVVNGNSVVTPWISVAVNESGPIMTDAPEEDAPEGMAYVKTTNDENAVPFVRATPENGFEYSHNGEDWENGINGLPDVPKDPKGQPPKRYLRIHGDWVEYEESEVSPGLAGEAPELPPIDGSTEVTIADLVAKYNAMINALKVRGVTA